MEIPEPKKTGSSGTQEIGQPEDFETKEKSPLNGLSIAHRVEGLAATHSRSMGGEVAANLIAGILAQLNYDLQEAQRKLDLKEEKLENTKEDLATYKTRSSVLEERLKTNIESRHLKNLSLTIGIVLISIAIELFRNDLNNLSYVLAFIGSILVILGWFTIRGRIEE